MAVESYAPLELWASHGGGQSSALPSRDALPDGCADSAEERSDGTPSSPSLRRALGRLARAASGVVAVGIAAALFGACVVGLSRFPQLRRPARAQTASSAVHLGGSTVQKVALLDDQLPRPLCNPHVPMGPPPSAFGQPRSWYLDEKTQERCKEELGKLSKEQYTHSNVAAHGRQWCWMGMKEFGCHRVVNQRYTWKEAQSFAALMNVTVPPKVASFQPLLRPEVCEVQSLGKPRRWTQEELTAARSWFEDNVQLYVLNMAAFKARWRTMTERLAKLDLESIRVEGVDLRPPDAMKSVVDEGLIPEGFNYSEASHEAAKASNNMGGGILGTVGCAAAHFRAQTRALVDSGRGGGKPLAVVLEDDVALAEDFVVRLWSLVREELPCDWEVVSLSSRCPYGTCVSPHISRVEPDGNEPASRCRHGVNYGFQGVLYRSSRIPDFQGTWKKTVFDSERPHCLDIDVALASISDRVGFYAVPFIQKPGFLEEVWQGSAREAVNR